jgi:hypothetical protein
MLVNFPHAQVLEFSKTFFRFPFLLSWTYFLCIIMTIIFYFYKYLFRLVESNSGLMWMETHACCYWSRKCIFLGKRCEWPTRAWWHLRPVTSRARNHILNIVLHNFYTSLQGLNINVISLGFTGIFQRLLMLSVLMDVVRST